MFRRILFFILCIVLLSVTIACNSSATEEPTATPEPGEISAETAVPATKPITEPTDIVETAVIDEDPACTLAQAITLSAGPGLSFDPLRELSPDETFTPLAFSAQGFPDGQWLEVEVTDTGEQGWVSAGPAFVTCNVNILSLPPATNIPPTPTIEPTDTPEIVAQGGPPRITNNAPGGTKAEYVKDEVIVDDEFLFRMWIADTRFGQQDGAGISHVDFTILTQDESEVIYHNLEDHAAYCVFQGGLPDCNPWLEENGRFYWPNGVEVQDSGYHATILVYPQHPAFNDEVWNWDFNFWIDLP